MTTRSAKILRLTDNGIGYMNDNVSHSITAFSFEQIKGYKGETAKELGLFNGTEVIVEYDDDQHINAVSIPNK
jgi:hypothetical protein